MFIRQSEPYFGNQNWNTAEAESAEAVFDMPLNSQESQDTRVTQLVQEVLPHAIQKPLSETAPSQTKATQAERSTSEEVSHQKPLSETASSETSQIQSSLYEEISQMSFILLIFEMLKLAIVHDQQEKVFRSEERRLMILHMERVATNYKEQGNFLLISNVIGGVLEILSGALPIFGHNARFGKIVYEKLSKCMGFETLKQFKFYTHLSKMLHGAAELGKSSGQVQHMFAEQNRTRDEYRGRIHQTDEGENTRVLEERNRLREEIVRQALQLMQMLSQNASANNHG